MHVRSGPVAPCLPDGLSSRQPSHHALPVQALLLLLGSTGAQAASSSLQQPQQQHQAVVADGSHSMMMEAQAGAPLMPCPLPLLQHPS